MSKLKLKTPGRQMKIKAKLQMGEKWNSREVSFLTSESLPGFVRLEQTKGRSAIFSATADCTLASFLSNGISREAFFRILLQFVNVLNGMDYAHLLQANLMDDPEWIFVNRQTGQVSFLYQPIENPKAVANLRPLLARIANAAAGYDTEPAAIVQLRNMIAAAGAIRNQDLETLICAFRPELRGSIVHSKMASLHANNSFRPAVMEAGGLAGGRSASGAYGLKPGGSFAPRGSGTSSILDFDGGAEYMQEQTAPDAYPILNGNASRGRFDGESAYGDNCAYGGSSAYGGGYGRESGYGGENAFSDESGDGYGREDSYENKNPAFGGAYDGGTVSLGSVSSHRAVRRAALRRVKTGETADVNKQVFRIGRLPDRVDFALRDNPAVGRTHADIILRDNNYYIYDNNSLNGTFVNGQRIPAMQETPLSDRCTFRIADEDFEFLVVME